MSEQTIYQSGNVRITSSRAAFGGDTYFLRNISHVSVVREGGKNHADAVKLSTYLACGSIILLLFASGILAVSAWIVLTLSIVLIILVFLQRKYCLRLHTNAGSVSCCYGPSTWLHEIKSKIEEAIAALE